MSRRGEAIYHRKDGLWEARYVKGLNAAGKKAYGSVYAHSYREAKEKRQDILSQLALLPQATSARRMTVSRLVAEWLYVNQGRVKKSTYHKYSGIFNSHIKDELGDILVIYLSPLLLRQYTETKERQGLSPTTINSILTFLGTCLKYGHRQYGTPTVDIIYLKRPRLEMRVLSVEEQTQLVHLLLDHTDAYKLGILLALYTGIRVGELCALTWGDIKDGKVRVNKTMQRLSKGKGHGTELLIGEPKTGTSNRVIPLPSFLNGVVEPFRGADSQRILGDKRLVEPRTMQYHFRKYTQQLDLADANFHSLRHTFATRCVEAGFEIRSLSEILGHSNVSITLNRYVHSSFELKSHNMEKLSLHA